MNMASTAAIQVSASWPYTRCCHMVSHPTMRAMRV